MKRKKRRGFPATTLSNSYKLNITIQSSIGMTGVRILRALAFYTGILPCFFGGLLWFLLRVISSA